MLPSINSIKGVHPGVVLERELRRRRLKKGQFALTIQEFPQTLTAITIGRRRMNPSLSLKVEQALAVEEGYFMALQAYFDVAQEKKRLVQERAKPNLKVLRPILFWDTDVNGIDWQAQKKAVIKRVFERGNRDEVTEIIRFYGKNTINEVLTLVGRHYGDLLRERIVSHLSL